MSERIASLDDHRRLRDTWRLDCPERFNFGHHVIDRWARERPDHPAIDWVGPQRERRVTFAELAERSDRVAAALAELGLERGARVLVVLPRIVEWWETLLGLFKAGMVAIPGTTLLTTGDIAYRAGSAEAVAIITDAAGAEKVDAGDASVKGLAHKILVGRNGRPGWHCYDRIVESAAAADPVNTRGDETAMIYFTSGTTGMPKMVPHTHASYGVGHRVTLLWLDLGPDDLHWNISDTGWAKAAWSSLFGPWIRGATLFVHHATGKFNPADVLRMLAERPITTMCAAPTIYRLLIQQDLGNFRPAALRHCVAAGEPLNPEVMATWERATGVTIRDGYGQTETVLLCGNFPGVPVKPGSMGLPPPGIELAVIDAAGRPLPPGIEGDLAVRVSPRRPLGMFGGYWRDPRATQAAIRGEWYVTGDCGRVDEDGYFWFVGRADDVITSSAYRIGPFEVESALLEHPAVAEAAVVGKRDALRGQLVKAFVVLAAGHEGSESLVAQLQEHTRRTTAPYKYPREIEFVAELPKTTSGKIRRVELREGT